MCTFILHSFRRAQCGSPKLFIRSLRVICYTGVANHVLTYSVNDLTYYSKHLSARVLVPRRGELCSPEPRRPAFVMRCLPSYSFECGETTTPLNPYTIGRLAFVPVVPRRGDPVWSPASPIHAKKALIFIRQALMWNPAATYSPGPLPAKYHRR